jgi:hypothetical protein
MIFSIADSIVFLLRHIEHVLNSLSASLSPKKSSTNFIFILFFDFAFAFVCHAIGG